MFERLGDTIVAIGTPHGRGQRGVVRLSGGAALAIAARMFRPADGASFEHGTENVRLLGRLAVSEDRFLLPGELLIFRAPRSYTREDVAELHTVGASAALALIVDRAIRLGARQAEAGEFTGRAFYYGAYDLSEVEGISALIHARSDQQLRAAHQWLDGRLAGEIRQLQEELVDLVSLVEADIDFAEEPIEFITPAKLADRLRRVIPRISELLAHSADSEQVARLPRVLLVGRPNSGKSTLMNLLSGVARAICSPVAGTTRDCLSTVVALPDGEIELIDTAGLGENGGQFEKISKFFVDREIRHVELVCHLLDLTAPPLHDHILPGVLSRRGPILWVATKVDLVGQARIEQSRAAFAQHCQAPLQVISAKTGKGLSALRSSLNAHLFGGCDSIECHGVAINERHRGALGDALDALGRAEQCCGQNSDMIDCAEWVASDLRCAVNALGTIFGEVTTDHLLHRIFRGFCIGK